MYLLLVFAFILLGIDGITPENNFNTTQDALELAIIRQNIEQMVAMHKKLSLTHWEYNEQCRVTLENGYYPICRPPMTSYSGFNYCFGTAIKYNYTSSSDWKFPEYFKVLSSFPRCWSQLRPLLCSTYYRPCVLKSLQAKSSGASKSLIFPQLEELWEVFPTVFCTHAKEECGFLVEMNFWPYFLDCGDTVETTKLGNVITRKSPWRENQGVYNEECKVNYREDPIKPETHECIWPLVTKSSNDVTVNAKPLIDDCYLPCSKSGGFREALSICTLTSWLLTSSFITLNAWIADFLIHFILGTSRERDYELPIKTVKGGGNPRIDPRRFHQMSIYLLASFYSLFNLFLIDIPTNGQFGICYYGVGDIKTISVIYGPVYVMAFIVLVMFIRKLVNRKLTGKPSEVTSNLSSRADEYRLPATTTETQREYQSQPKEAYIGNRNWLKTTTCLSKLCRYISVAYFLYIVLSAVSQYFLFWSEMQETEAILDGIRCRLIYELSILPRISKGWSYSTPKCDLYSEPDEIIRIPTILYVFLYPALPLIVAILWFFHGWIFKTRHNESLFLIRKNIIPCTRDTTNDYIELEALQESGRTASHNRNHHDFALQHNPQQRLMINNHQYDQANGNQLRRCASCEVLWAVQTPVLGHTMQMPPPASNATINFVYYLN
ncbi:hypothetical protein Ddc_15444 [Ditylenchus destructor]|nr:hypothetical protein Ddc_15444 [Ditylenchus destructor]